MGTKTYFWQRDFWIKEQPEPTKQTDSNYYHNHGEWWPIVNKRWDGEKTPGELGTVFRNFQTF